jgi:hypothetical protein
MLTTLEDIHPVAALGSAGSWTLYQGLVPCGFCTTDSTVPSFSFLISAEEVLAALRTRAAVTLTITLEASALGAGVAAGFTAGFVPDFVLAAAAGFFGVGSFLTGVGAGPVSERKLLPASADAALKAKKHMPNKTSKPKNRAMANLKFLVGFDIVFLC